MQCCWLLQVESSQVSPKLQKWLEHISANPLMKFSLVLQVEIPMEVSFAMALL